MVEEHSKNKSFNADNRALSLLLRTPQWRINGLEKISQSKIQDHIKGGSGRMKAKILILLSSLVLIAFFAVIALSVDWSNPEGKSADDLISGSDDGTIQPVDSGLGATPQKSRTKWSNRTGVDFTMPSTLSSGADSAKGSRVQAEATAAAQDETVNDQDTAQTTDQTPVETPQTEETASEPAATTATGAIAGSWSFELNDNTVKEMVLTLFQSEDAVFGTGSMKDGNSTLLVAASGSNDGDKLNLDITSYGSINLYRLALTSSGDSASGDYKAFSASGQSWTGNAQGTRSS